VWTRIREVIDVAVDHVELLRAVSDHPDLEQMGADRIRGARIQPQGARHRGDQPGRGPGITTREEGDLVPTADEFFGEPVNHAFRAAVKTRRDPLVQWRDLSDPHAFSLQPLAGISGHARKQQGGAGRARSASRGSRMPARTV